MHAIEIRTRGLGVTFLSRNKERLRKIVRETVKKKKDVRIMEFMPKDSDIKEEVLEALKQRRTTMVAVWYDGDEPQSFEVYKRED